MSTLEPTAAEIEAMLKARNAPVDLDAAEAEAKCKSETMAQAAASTPPSAADTVIMLAHTNTAQRFLVGLIALCMQAESDGVGQVMFYSKKGKARFTVELKGRTPGHPMLFIGEGENLFTASASLHQQIQAYAAPNHANGPAPENRADAADGGDQRAQGVADAGAAAAPADHGAQRP